MRVRNQTRYCITVVLVLASAALGYKSAKPLRWSFQATAQAPQGRPIPPAGPLAGPKSLKQVGVPVEATRAAVPADNPQTPEKIALGERLFFDGRLSVDGTVAC